MAKGNKKTDDIFKHGSDQRQLPEKSIQRSYEAVIDRCARLLSFAASPPPGDLVEMSALQNVMAIDDLIILGLHARRLISDAQFSELATNVRVPTVVIDTDREKYIFPKDGNDVAITRLFNIIIHHKFLEIHRESREIHRHVILAQGRRPTLDDILSHDAHSFPAKLLVRSDKSDTTFVDLSEFILLFAERVLDPLVDYCAGQGIFLERSLYE